MAVNLATKYSDKIAAAFTKSSFVRGKVSNRYEFTGAKTLKVYTPVTVDEVDYRRNGVNRYGDPKEMQDTVQEMTVTQDKAFNLTIDKGNNADQMNVKNAGEMLKLQLQEKSTPAADRYAFKQAAMKAGSIMTVSAKPTKSNIVSTVFDMAQKMDDNLVPDEGRYLFVTSEMYKFICISDEFIAIDKLGEKSISRGEVGEIAGFRLVKVPGSYLPANCFAIAWHKDAVLMPYKIQDTKIHKDPPGISGHLMEGRHYYDLFVLGAKSGGVVVLVLAGEKLAAPTVAIASHQATITQASAGTIWYTDDGSDPRYSDSRKMIASGGTVTTTSGQTVKAVAYHTNGKFTSDIGEDTDDDT